MKTPDLATLITALLVAGLHADARALGGAIPFAPAQFYSGGELPFQVAIADLNGDGRQDVAVTNADPAGGCSVLLNNGGGAFAAPARHMDGIATRCIAAADFDGDGDRDLAVGLLDGSPLLAVSRNQGDGTFGAPALSGSGGHRPDICLSRDFDGDGDSDIVMGLAGTGLIAFFRNPGNGTFAAPTIYTSVNPAYSTDLTSADFDGDGDLDLATVRALSPEQPLLLRNNGDGTFAAPETVYTSTYSHVGLAAGDIDRDGDQDLALLMQPGHMTISRNDGSGRFGLPELHYLSASIANGSRMTLADLDADAAPEAIVADANGAAVLVLRNDAGVFAPPDSYFAGLRPTVPAGADLDGDQDVDIAVSGFTTDKVIVLLNQSPIATGVPAAHEPADVRLTLAAQPNPMGGMTTIHYDVADAGPVRITLHDVSGRLVGVLLDRSVAAGRGSVTWSGHGERGERLAAGRYFLRIEGRKVEGNSSATCPIVLNQ